MPGVRVLGAICDGVTLYGALKLEIEKRAKTRRFHRYLYLCIALLSMHMTCL